MSYISNYYFIFCFEKIMVLNIPCNKNISVSFYCILNQKTSGTAADSNFFNFFTSETGMPYATSLSNIFKKI